MTTGSRYDGIADWYDTEFQPAPLESETWEVLVRLLGKGSGSLIDVGCGTGSYTAALAELGWDVTGVDISEDMLRRARARGVHAGLRLEQIEEPAQREYPFILGLRWCR